ncbi:MAG: hypothetical protein AVDCRST_MAG68-2126 [uncultured Gemmatimonadetes bacterium]|uniref:Uncharacterized protein n=1 Tax=uncultured Gemmatimonadota bacterium TaxID=203437 RepID=A0A6J4L5Z2_9BACT|nr:MAG: hypothetical protein AVDCRST_MAG68-2126 [uncultured Gemmatimonadota bacterium]
MRPTRKGFDLSGLSPEHRTVIEPAIVACTFPTTRILRNTGKPVPVAVSDLSRFNAAMEAHGHGHVHVDGEHGHLLGEPDAARKAPLGLYWLPTADHPAGRIEVGAHAMSDPDLAREVFLAEAAHAVDYGAMTDAQREAIRDRFDYTGQGEPPVGWFEEIGEQDYWDWRGERWMGLFMAAFAPSLPRPLETRQPWTWSYDTSDCRRARSIMRRA